MRPRRLGAPRAGASIGGRAGSPPRHMGPRLVGVLSWLWCACAGASPFEWILEIEASGGGRSFVLNATEYAIDRQYQLPAGTSLRGAAGGTVIRAVHVGEPYESVCGANAKHRKGLLLGDDTYVGQLHFVGVETKRPGPRKGASIVLQLSRVVWATDQHECVTRNTHPPSSRETSKSDDHPESVDPRKTPDTLESS